MHYLPKVVKTLTRSHFARQRAIDYEIIKNVLEMRSETRGGLVVRSITAQDGADVGQPAGQVQTSPVTAWYNFLEGNEVEENPAVEILVGFLRQIPQRARELGVRNTG